MGDNSGDHCDCDGGDIVLTIPEITRVIQEDAVSKKKKQAAVGRRYYEAEHDILDYRLFYFNSDGKLVEDTVRSNIRISHPFFAELVDQEVQYLLSGKEGFVRSDDPELQTSLDEYFDDEFRAELSETLTDTVVSGFGYMYAYMTEKGRLAFQYAETRGVIEVRAKDTDDGAAYVVYWYIDRMAKSNKKVKRIQVWDDTQTYFYVQEDDGKIVPDTSEPINPRPHITYTKGDSGDIFYESFGYIPFFRLDNNRKQYSGLKPVKDLIDDYDLMACGLSNNLTDFDNPLHVVKGFQGDNLDELATNLRTKKMIGTDSEGGVEVHTVDIPYEARKTKMELDEKNIYRFGMGFNSAMVGDGNVTNVVIKSRYALLDLKCNKLEIQLRKFLKEIIKVVLEEINRTNDSDYTLKNVYIELEREIMTNASDNADIELKDAQKRQVDINTILSLASVLDNETTLRATCEVLDIDYDEVQRRIKEQEEKEDLSMFLTDTPDGGDAE